MRSFEYYLQINDSVANCLMSTLTRLGYFQANRSDVSHIYSAINSRVQQLRAQEQKDKPTEAASTENTKEASQDEPAPQTHAEKRKSDTSSPEEQPSKRTKTRHNVKRYVPVMCK